MNLLFLLLILMMPSLAFAGFEARVAPGETASRIIFMLSATTTSVNAVEGTLVLPQGMAAKNIYTGGSIIGSWVEAPRVEEGRIRFAGIIPGGFTGSATAGEGLTGPGELFSFELTGQGPLSVVGAYQYLNDGAGTKIAIPALLVPETLVSGSPFQEEDRTPPEYVEAHMSTGVIEGKTALLIEAYDADSGVDRFEVQEGSGLWEPSDAVYEVKDRSGFLSLSVRAYDRAGNFIETKVEGKNAVYMKIASAVVILVLILIVGSLLVYFKKRRAS